MTATSPHSGWACEEKGMDARARTAAPAPTRASNSETPERSSWPGAAGTPAAWEVRFEDPFNRYYRAPLARRLLQALERAKVLPDRVTAAQPLLAALAGYFVMFADGTHLALAAGLF